MAHKEEIIRFTVSLPGRLLDELDRQAAKKGYPSRSECVRDLIRDQMVEDKWSDTNEEVIGVLTIGFDHHQRHLTQKLIDIQHDHHAHVLCSTHVHLDHDNCLEVIIIRGQPADITDIQSRIGAQRGVKFARLSRAGRLGV